MRRRVTSHQPPMMTRDCGDGSFTVRSCGGWRVVFFSLYVDTVMNAKFGEVAYTLHSNCDVWSPNLKKSLMFGLCHLFIVVSMSKLRNPIGEEAGDIRGGIAPLWQGWQGWRHLFFMPN